MYSQIGLVMLIGLAAKNAILIVEFAKDEFEKGKNLVDAALEGARLRLRPILMTSFAFILGCVPLWTASGAGSVARQIMGTTVIGGMLAASVIGIFFIPAIFYVVERVSGATNKAPVVVQPEPAPVARRLMMREVICRAGDRRGHCSRAAPWGRTISGLRFRLRPTFVHRRELPTADPASVGDLKWFEVFKDESFRSSSGRLWSRTTTYGMRLRGSMPPGRS